MKYGKNNCEICSSNDWQSLGECVYFSEEINRADTFNKKRFRVLFEKWFPCASPVSLEYICCRRCGFVVFSPRPEKSDVDTKYRFIEELGQDYGQVSASSAGERERARVLFEFLAKYINLANIHTVLDYGGGDGRLMHYFQQAGMNCSLIDYNRNCVSGVCKLADTIDSVAPAVMFDLIICSHVLEHVAEPLEVIRALSCHLNKDGYLFIEVPMEIWGSLSGVYEPVTHINWFTPNSVWNLLALAGLQPLRSMLTRYLHPNGEWYHGVRSLAVRQVNSNKSVSLNLRRLDIDKYTLLSGYKLNNSNWL